MFPMPAAVSRRQPGSAVDFGCWSFRPSSAGFSRFSFELHRVQAPIAACRQTLDWGHASGRDFGQSACSAPTETERDLTMARRRCPWKGRRQAIRLRPLCHGARTAASSLGLIYPEAGCASIVWAATPPHELSSPALQAHSSRDNKVLRAASSAPLRSVPDAAPIASGLFDRRRDPMRSGGSLLWYG
jgi:hypothetical protein